MTNQQNNAGGTGGVGGTSGDSGRPHGPMRRYLTGAMNVVRRNPIKSIIALEIAAVMYYRAEKAKQTAEDDKKKRVLVVPFHRMKIVEKKDRSLRSLLRSNLASSNRSSGEDSSTIVMEVDEVVKLIHAASEDPNIVALYGQFGQGFGFETGGWAHIEEIRNALQVFRESHRVHKEPNLNHDATVQRHSNRIPKPLYAFADTFASPINGEKEYYLASAFTHIALQPQGDLNLFGLCRTDVFLKDALKKYGIKLHVFKHGAYKNAPNMFTESKYTPSHRENVQNIIVETNRYIYDAIYTSRRLSGFHGGAKNFWPLIHQAGTLSAEMAQKVGFVDYMPLIDPLGQLVSSNKSPEDKKKSKEKWGKSIDLDQFTAEKSISIDKYAAKIKTKERKEKAKWIWHQRLKGLSESSTFGQAFMSLAGYNAPNFNIDKMEFAIKKAEMPKEKIAVIKIDEAITDSTAKKVKSMLREIREEKNTKCVVLRVNSPGGSVTACETIYQELKDMPQRHIVSFGNVSASGGYYISAAADRIFASPTTVTGSIGVFMIRFDFRELAAQYGVKASSITMGDLSNSFSSLTPMNSRMKSNFASYADRQYLHFKSLVAEGRQMSMEETERLAQGRVWTGEQARQFGLVDELGGLSRTIAYAQRNYTNCGRAEVETWPREKSAMSMLTSMIEDDNNPMVLSLLQLFSDLVQPSGGSDQGAELGLSGLSLPTSLTGMSQPMLTVDEHWAIRCVLEENDVPQIWKKYPPSFWQ